MLVAALKDSERQNAIPGSAPLKYNYNNLGHWKV